MDESVEPLPDEGFDIVMRGYARDQVEDYVERAENVAEQLRARVAELERQVATLHLRLEESGHPAHAEVGARLNRLLRLAEDEADDLVRQAKDDAERVRGEAEREIGQLRRNATIEAERIIEHAKDTAEQLVQVAIADAEIVRNETDEHVERALVEVTRQRAELDRRRDELDRRREELDAWLARIRAVLAETGWIE